MAHEAMDIYADKNPNSPTVQYIDTIASGARGGDTHDHIYDLQDDQPVVFGTGAWTTLSHFWDADKGPDDVVAIEVDWELGTFTKTSPGNAWQAAQMYWGMAIGNYRDGNYFRAYEYLGHVVHLLNDMSLPAHAHEDGHFSDDDCYEDWMDDYGSDNVYYNYMIKPNEHQNLIDKGPVAIPDGVYPLEYLFYTTNQVGDFFASDNVDGDPNDPLGWMDEVRADVGLNSIVRPLFAADLDDNEVGDNDDDGDLTIIRDHSYLYSIRAVAALYQLFDETVSNASYLSIKIDKVKELEAHEDPLLRR